ncbi:hypothetical protein CRUP_016017 [Coryphaenoides rupestris]|nr:hypothetical protein CRUP_016017 [Coryphaenoides rupestris]
MADVHVSHVVHPAENGGPLLSAAEQDDVVVDEDSVQFRVMRAYVRRRRPQVNVAPVALPSAEPVVEAETKKGRRSGGIKKRLLQIFSCVRGEADEAPGVANGGQSAGFRTLGVTAPKEEEGVDELATTLIKLADVSFHPPAIETDSEEDDMERLAGLLLRTCGDELHEKHDCNQLFKDLLGSYSLFDKLMSAIFRKMGNQQAVHR